MHGGTSRTPVTRVGRSWAGEAAAREDAARALAVRGPSAAAACTSAAADSCEALPATIPSVVQEVSAEGGQSEACLEPPSDFFLRSPLALSPEMPSEVGAAPPAPAEQAPQTESEWC